MLCLVVWVLCQFLDLRAFNYLEQYGYDLRMGVLARDTRPQAAAMRDRIVLVAIRRSTQDALPGYPPSRALHGELADALIDAGAEVIAFDILFLADKPEEDARLARAASRSPRVVWGGKLDEDRPGVFVRSNRPTQALREASPTWGFLNVVPDDDHHEIDRVLVSAVVDGAETRAFSARVAQAAGTAGPIPVDGRGMMRITYFGLPGTLFRTVPMERVLEAARQRDTAWLRDAFGGKTVLIGDETVDGHDFHQTPVGRMSGLEIHAHAVATILTQAHIRPAPWWLNTLLILGGAIVVSLLGARLRPVWAVTATGLLVAGYFVANVAWFAYGSTVAHLVAPMAAMLLALAGTFILTAAVDDRRRRARTYDIFISYRRLGGDKTAQAVYLALKQRGCRVFLDVEELNRPCEFGPEIIKAIDSAPNLVVILSPGSMARCADPKDWVRQELVYALEHGRNIVPLFIDGFAFANEAIPDELTAIAGRQGVTLYSDMFQGCMAKLHGLMEDC